MPASKAQKSLQALMEKDAEDDTGDTFLTRVDIRKLPAIRGAATSAKATQQKPVAPSGFDRLHLSLRKVMGRMGAHSGDLDNKWEKISRYVDGFYNQTDSGEAAQHHWDIYMHAARKTSSLPIPNAPMTAVSCALLDHILFWFGSIQPVMGAIAAAVRQQVYHAIFPGELDEVPSVLQNSQLNAGTFEAAASRYMRSTYYDKLKQADNTAVLSNEIAQTIKELSQELEYWKEQYKGKVFTAWRTQVNATRKIKQERQEMLAEVKAEVEQQRRLQQELQDVRDELEQEKAVTRELRKQVRDMKNTYQESTAVREKEMHELIQSDARKQELEKSKTELHDLRVMLHNLLADLHLSGIPRHANWEEKMQQTNLEPHAFLLWFFNTTVASQPGGERYTVTSLVEGSHDIHNSVMIFLHVLLPPSLTRAQVEHLFKRPQTEKAAAIYNSIDQLDLNYMPLTPEELYNGAPGQGYELLVGMLFSRFADPKVNGLLGLPPLAPRLRKAGSINITEKMDENDHLSWTSETWQPAIAKALTENAQVRRVGMMINEELLGEHSEDTRLASRFECCVEQVYTIKTAAESLNIAEKDNTYDTKALTQMLARTLAENYEMDAKVFEAMPALELINKANELLALRGLACQTGVVTDLVAQNTVVNDLHQILQDELKKCDVHFTPPINIQTALQLAFNEFKVRSLQNLAVEFGQAGRDTVGILTRRELRDIVCKEIGLRMGMPFDQLLKESDANLLAKGQKATAVSLSGMTPEPPEGADVTSSNEDPPTLRVPDGNFLGAFGGLDIASPTPSADALLPDFPNPTEAVISLGTQRTANLHKATGPQLLAQYTTHVNRLDLAELLPTDASPTDWEVALDAIKIVVKSHLQLLHDTFKYYASTRSSYWTMCEQAFWKFCSDCKLVVGHDGASGAREFVNLMFIDANQFKAAQRKSLGSRQGGSRPTSTDSGADDDLEMDAGEYIKAIIKLAAHFHHDADLTPAMKFESILSSNVQKYAQKVIVDEFRAQIYREEVQAVIRKSKNKLIKVFKHYAKSKTAAVPKTEQKLDAIELEEFRLLARDAHLVNSHCTHETISHIYIYILEKEPHMFFYDFTEAIVALAAVHVPQPLEPLSTRLQNFLSHTFFSALSVKVRGVGHPKRASTE